MKEQPKSRVIIDPEKMTEATDAIRDLDLLCSEQPVGWIAAIQKKSITLNECLISRVSGEPPKPAVLVSRISDLVHKCADWKDGEITGFRMEEFEIRLFVILEKLSGEAKTPVNSAHSYTESSDVRLPKNDSAATMEYVNKINEVAQLAINQGFTHWLAGLEAVVALCNEYNARK